MSLITERSQIAVEIEAEEGTAETLEGADVLSPVYAATFEPSIEMHARNPLRATLSQLKSLAGKRSGKASFQIELVGTASAGSAVFFADAIKACGVGETLVAETSATYKPASSSISSVTVGRYVDGKRNRIWGARGNAKLVLEVGRPGIFTLDFQGADFDDADAALLSDGVVHQSVTPPVLLSASLSIDSYSALIEKVEIDFGNVLSLRPDANAGSGHKSCVITDRKPMLRFDPEAVLVATEDFLGNWRSGAEMAFTATLGSDAGNTIAVTAPKVQYQGLRETVKNGLLVYDVEALLAMSSGDDEWQIAIT